MGGPSQIQNRLKGVKLKGWEKKQKTDLGLCKAAVLNKKVYGNTTTLG